MSHFATSHSVTPYRHAPWCDRATVINEEARKAECSTEDGTCGKDVGDACAILMDRHGNTLVSAEVTVDLMTPQEALAVGLEIVRTAMLAGARVAI